MPSGIYIYVGLFAFVVALDLLYIITFFMGRHFSVQAQNNMDVLAKVHRLHRLRKSILLLIIVLSIALISGLFVQWRHVL
jgi:ABC-type Fe3+ transport system permease subunit